MERIVVFSLLLKIYLKELVDILFQKKYFSFKKDAKLYVQEIIVFILAFDFETNVRKTPKSLQKFGKNYFKYKANNHTTWYIFFDKKNSKFLVNYILNNHSNDFPELL